MEHVDEIMTDTKCDLCNTELVEIPGTSGTVWHWCPYCGSLFQGTRPNIGEFIRMCDIAKRIEW